jgi:TonB-linked SusC/RagA family outer membrane protein
MKGDFRLSALLISALLLPIGLGAQDATITGAIRNQAQNPVRGASVFIPGTSIGTVTNDQGAYLLHVPDGAGRQVTLRVEMIGYRPATVTVTLTAGTMREDITLVEEAIALDEIIVTGTAGRQQRRAQSAVVSSIDATQVSEVAPVSSVQQLLQSRLPGVDVQAAGGTVGGTQVIRMRGQASLTLSNEPLIFVDGVRVNQRSEQLFGVGGQQVSRLNDLRPEDIEDVEVIKGPAAATLYGADASAGVIQIITKRGRENSNFTQSVSAEYHVLDWSWWNPPSNWATCGSDDVADPNSMCSGLSVGDLVSDNPLERTNAIQQGYSESFNWQGQGGGTNHNYFLSVGAGRDRGAFINNRANNVSLQGNFAFQATPKLRMEMGMGVIRNETRFPRNDNDIYGWLGGALLGSPLTVGTNARDGWYAANRQNAAISAYENFNTNMRATPRVQVNYSPVQWLTNRLLVGADMSRVEARSFFPKNSNGWYSGVNNTGNISQGRENYDRLTVDYLGNISNALTSAISSDLSFGGQFIATRRDYTSANGIGLTTNSANAIDQAAQTTGGQTYTAQREIGVFGQWQVGYKDRLYVQFAGRLDKHSSFGVDAGAFFSPKVGASWVISDEPFWQNSMPEAISTLRLRAALGTTGRSPNQGALATYTSSPYALADGSVGSGVEAENLGNPDLKPERGREIEAGFEAGLLDERMGLEFTYFNKKGTNVILRRPLPSSAGFIENQLVNIGQVSNAGFEVAANALILTSDQVSWSVRLGFNTLKSEVVDLGGIEPYSSGWSQQVEQGYEPNAFFTRQVTHFILNASDPQASVCDTDANGDIIPCAIVTNEPTFKGHYLPTFEGNVSQQLTLFRNLRLYAQLDWKNNFMIYNNTDQFRERQFGQGERWVRRNDPAFGLAPEDRIRRFGPFFEADLDANGDPIGTYSSVSAGVVDDAYVEPGDFTRLREVSLSYTLPRALVSYIRSSASATLTLGGRNLALWSKYSGPDPEVGLYLSNDRREDFLTLPQGRTFFARLSFQF